MKKRLIFEVEEGETMECNSCAFSELVECDYDECYHNELHVCENGLKSIFDCDKYDLSTLKFIGEEEIEHKN